MTDTWNPTQYDKFQREREQPFFDLLALAHPTPNMRAVDLWCGTHRLTHAPHARPPSSETTGIDRAARLLEDMERAGLVSTMQSNGNREILVPARDA